MSSPDEPSSPGSLPHLPYPNSTSSLTEQRFKVKLAPLLDIAIGYVEGLQEASDRVISDVSKCDMDDLDLHDWYWETENDAQFYALSYRSKETDDEEIWNDSLPDHLRLPAFFTRNCSKTVYCLLPLVREILEDDQNFSKAVWSRVYIDIQLVLFDVDDKGHQVEEPLSFVAHDFITVITKDNKRFAVDFTGEQFGIQNWLQTKKDFNRHVMKTREPSHTSEHYKAMEVEDENDRNSTLRSVIADTMEEVNDERTRKGITWDVIHLLPTAKQDQLHKELITMIRARIVEAVRSES